jgi:cyanophycinase
MPGPLVLMGGDEFRRDCLPMDRDLLARIGRTPARVVIVPTAAARENPRRAADNGIRYFEGLGASATALMILTRADANDPDRSAPVRQADLIYLTGGDPRHLLSALAGSVAWAIIGQRWQVGATLVGSSAGAMALAGILAYGGPPVEALGAAPGVVVRPHFSGSLGQISPALGEGLPPGLTVFGIPAASGAVSSDGRRWDVLGAKNVAVCPPEPEPSFLVQPGDHFLLGD